jgi:hypothetical protein
MITKIQDMQPFMTDVTCTFVVLERLPTTQAQGGTTQYLVGDDTACIHLHIWEKDFQYLIQNQQQRVATTTPVAAAEPKKEEQPFPPSSSILFPGDICRITNGHCTMWKASLGLYIGRKGTIERLGEFCMAFNELKNMSTIEYTAQQLAELNKRMQQQQQQQQQQQA